MPKIVLPPIPTEGQPLLRSTEISDVNDPVVASIYSSELGSDKGLMSNSNGLLTTQNLSKDFLLRAEHIQHEQAMLSRTDSMLDTSTIYGTGIANNTLNSENDTFSEERFVNVPGCTLRWYQPYATSVSILQWSFFFSYNNWRGVYRDGSGREYYEGVNSTMKFRCVVNGDVVPASERVLGQNMFHPVSPAARDKSSAVGPGISLYPADTDGGDGKSTPDRGGNPRYVQTEAHSAHHVDMHHVAALTKGFNEISIQCAALLPQGEAVYLQNVGAFRRGKFKMAGYFNLVGKLSFGIRNTRVLNFL